MANSNLVDHQTNTGAMLNLAYNPSAMDRFKSQKNEDESPVAGGRRPDWIDNPPEGMRVSKGTSKSMGLAKQKAGAGGTQTHTEADNGVYTVYVLIPAPGRPEEPLQDTEDTDIGLGDYDPPELEIDLEDLAPEEEEEIVTDPLSDPQSQGLQGEIQDRQQVEDEVEDDFSNRRQQFLKTQGAGQDSVLAPDPNSLESQLLEQSTKAKGQSAVTSAEPEAYTPRKPLLERFAPDLFGNLNRSAADDVTGNIAEAVDPSKFSAGGLSREEYYQRSIDQAQGRVGRGMFGFGNDGQDDVDRAQERSDRFRFYEEEPTEDESASAGVPRVSQNPPAPSASDLMRATAENTVGFGAATPPENEMTSRYEQRGPSVNPYSKAPAPTPAAAKAAMPAASAAQEEEEQGGGFMSRLAGLGGGIGGFVKDNPDLMLQGLQTVGELGGAYKRSRREEEAAQRMAEEARMGTAISALTRGRVNPSVAPQMPRTSAGEGMFDVMAGIGRGGQEFMAGDRQRADKMRAEGIEEDEIARQTARDKELMGLERYDAETRRMAATGKIEKDLKKTKDAAEKEAKKSKLKQEDADYIAGQLKRMKTLFDEGNFLTMGGASVEQGWLPGATRQKEFDAVKGSLLGYMNQIMRLGRMSDNDVKLIQQQLPDRDKPTAYNEGVFSGLLGNLQAITPEWTSSRFGETGSGFEGGSIAKTSRWGGLQFTDDELSDLSDDEIDGLSAADLKALKAEMIERGLQ
tara:strand:+ start:562 stop:2784 length:2223 start_codon:yes stop_codon:yes gene_type:complete